MLTIERTDEYVLLKMPVTTSEAQLEAIQKAYNSTMPDFEALLRQDQKEGLIDEEGFIIDPIILNMSRDARKGGWEKVKNIFKDDPRLEEFIKEEE